MKKLSKKQYKELRRKKQEAKKLDRQENQGFGHLDYELQTYSMEPDYSFMPSLLLMQAYMMRNNKSMWRAPQNKRK